jgi:hypothetical protein
VSLEDLSKAILGRREVDQLTEILIKAPVEPTADRLSSINRFKNTIHAILPDIGEQVADEILGTRPIKAARDLTRLALKASGVKKAPLVEDSARPVMPAHKPTSQKGKLKRKGTGTPKIRPHRPDGSTTGILSNYAGCRLYASPVLVWFTPGSLSERSYRLVKENPGITYREFKERGGDTDHLSREVAKGKIIPVPMEGE